MFDKEEFLPLDPTQDLIFPPELIVSSADELLMLRSTFNVNCNMNTALSPQLVAETVNPQTLTFCGERMSWVSPSSLEELVQLKTSNPKAPLVMGNTNIGEQ